MWRNQILGYVLWGVLNEYISKAKGVREVRERLFIPLGISGRNHGNWHKHIGRVVVLVKETHESGGEYARRLSTFEGYALRTIVILRNIHAVRHARCSWSAGMHRSCYIHYFLSQRLMWGRRWFEELGLLQPAGWVIRVARQKNNAAKYDSFGRISSSYIEELYIVMVDWWCIWLCGLSEMNKNLWSCSEGQAISTRCSWSDVR